MKHSNHVDVAVIGGGPAGISACLELSRSSSLKVGLFECDPDLGGMPRSCHLFFGMRDQGRLQTGPAYARKLNSLIRKTGIEIHTEARVLEITPGGSGTPHCIQVLSSSGLNEYQCRFVVLSTGCFESPRSARKIPGARPAGIFTTGQLQQLVNQRQLKPGRKALIVGSEHVALSSVLTLKRAGMSIVGLVEKDPELQTYLHPARAMSGIFNFPIYKETCILSIQGNRRVEAVDLISKKEKKQWRVECDTVVLTGRFRPDSMLIENTRIEQDKATLGPVVDMDLMTSVPNIFAAGNLLRGADMHDLCALEGRLAARSIFRKLESNGRREFQSTGISVNPPIRFVVPQKIILPHIRKRLFSKLFPWPAIQVERTLNNSVMEAWSGETKIWSGGFRKLLANTRIPLPLEKFDWKRADLRQGVDLRIKTSRNDLTEIL